MGNFEKNNKIYTVDEIRQKLVPVFSNAPVYKAILFGSYAKGQADGQSDIDIVIDSKRELLGLRFFGVRGAAEDIIQKEIDMIEISQIKKDSPFFNDIYNEGIVIYER